MRKLTVSHRMENFITGYPGSEFQIRETLAEVLGEKKARFFFDKVKHSNRFCQMSSINTYPSSWSISSGKTTPYSSKHSA